jgi:hypothetical protein
MLVCTFGYSWSLTILGRDQEEWGIDEITGAASTTYVDDIWKWNTLKRRPQHCTLDFDESPSVGEDGENPKSSMHKNDDGDVNSILL